MSSMTVQFYRSIWVSDIHLGARGCKAEFLLDFLKHSECEYLYLVGDIVDGLSLKNSWAHWGEHHTALILKILKKLGDGTKVFLIPGNHDDILTRFAGLRFSGIQIVREAVHATADGRYFLITHGDQFENAIPRPPMVKRFSSWAYDAALALNHWYNRLRFRFGYAYRPLLGELKRKLKRAVFFVTEYERRVAAEARRRGLSGVICGHIHSPAILEMDGGVLYCNDGDWVESCTALVEHYNGSLEIVRWMKVEPELRSGILVNGYHGGHRADQDEYYGQDGQGD